MKKKSTSQSAPARRSLDEGGFFNLRVLIGLFIALAGVSLALAGFGAFSVQAQQKPQQKYRVSTRSSWDPLVPAGFDCSKIHELGIDKMENFAAQAIMIHCGLSEGGKPAPGHAFSKLVQSLMAPLTYGDTDVDLITGTESFPNVTQSETFTTANPDNPDQVVVAYNDSRGRNFTPINISGASVSNDGGCGGQGLGGYKSTTPDDPNSWTHFCAFNEGSADRESGWADNNPSSPFFGNMYISWNDFNFGNADIFVVRSTDSGATWSSPVHVSSGATFVRNVQITGDMSANGTIYIAGMDEGGGGFPHNDANLI